MPMNALELFCVKSSPQSIPELAYICLICSLSCACLLLKVLEWLWLKILPILTKVQCLSAVSNDTITEFAFPKVESKSIGTIPGEQSTVCSPLMTNVPDTTTSHHSERFAMSNTSVGFNDERVASVTFPYNSCVSVGSSNTHLQQPFLSTSIENLHKIGIVALNDSCCDKQLIEDTSENESVEYDSFQFTCIDNDIGTTGYVEEQYCKNVYGNGSQVPIEHNIKLMQLPFCDKDLEPTLLDHLCKPTKPLSVEEDLTSHTNIIPPNESDSNERSRLIEELHLHVEECSVLELSEELSMSEKNYPPGNEQMPVKSIFNANCISTDENCTQNNAESSGLKVVVATKPRKVDKDISSSELVNTLSSEEKSSKSSPSKEPHDDKSIKRLEEFACVSPDSFQSNYQEKRGCFSCFPILRPKSHTSRKLHLSSPQSAHVKPVPSNSSQVSVEDLTFMDECHPPLQDNEPVPKPLPPTQSPISRSSTSLEKKPNLPSSFHMGTFQMAKRLSSRTPESVSKHSSRHIRSRSDEKVPTCDSDEEKGTVFTPPNSFEDLAGLERIKVEKERKSASAPVEVSEIEPGPHLLPPNPETPTEFVVENISDSGQAEESLQMNIIANGSPEALEFLDFMSITDLGPSTVSSSDCPPTVSFSRDPSTLSASLKSGATFSQNSRTARSHSVPYGMQPTPDPSLKYVSCAQQESTGVSTTSETITHKSGLKRTSWHEIVDTSPASNMRLEPHLSKCLSHDAKSHVRAQNMTPRSLGKWKGEHGSFIKKFSNLVKHPMRTSRDFILASASHKSEPQMVAEHITPIAEDVRCPEEASEVIRPPGAVYERHDIPFASVSSAVPNSWSADVPGSSFQVRAANYLKDKKKCPSDIPLYETYQIEAYRTDCRTTNVSRLLGMTGEFVSGVPTDLVLNVMIPDYPPKALLWSSSKEGNEGLGISVIIHTRMTAETQAALAANSSNPEYKLLKNFLKGNCDDDTGLVPDEYQQDAKSHANKYRGQTKIIAMVGGGSENLPWAVRYALNQGNGKPFTVNRCGILYSGAGSGVFEIDVDVHNFATMAVKGLATCKTYFQQLIIDVCVLLEGQAPEELPERALACFRLCNPDFQNVLRHIDEVISPFIDKK